MSFLTLHSSLSLVAVLSYYNRTLYIVYATLAYSRLSFFNFFYIGHIYLTHAYSRLSLFNSFLYICPSYIYWTHVTAICLCVIVSCAQYTLLALTINPLCKLVFYTSVYCTDTL